MELAAAKTPAHHIILRRRGVEDGDQGSGTVMISESIPLEPLTLNKRVKYYDTSQGVHVPFAESKSEPEQLEDLEGQADHHGRLVSYTVVEERQNQREKGDREHTNHSDKRGHIVRRKLDHLRGM